MIQNHALISNYYFTLPDAHKRQHYQHLKTIRQIIWCFTAHIITLTPCFVTNFMFLILDKNDRISSIVIPYVSC
jgi:hypothetical protein